MGVDESFAEYVAARWSMLYRLAVLLAGDDEADDLTRAGLVSAYLSWPAVQDAASADDAVKRIVATTAVRDSRAQAEPTPTSTRPSLWASVSALPRRQRAVLVLRHYEGLYDAEIADVVHQSTSAVTAEAGALEAGIDLAELRDELVQRAEGAAIPMPPVEELLAQGHAARRGRARRTGTRLALVAAAVALGLGGLAAIQTWSTDRAAPSRPSPSATALPRLLSSLEHGAAPRTAYSVRRFLYLPGGRGVDLDERPAAIAQTHDWVYIAYLSGRIVRVSTDTLAIEPVVDRSGGQLVTDADGEDVAWLSSTARKALVFVISLDLGEVADTRVQTFPATLRCCDDPFRINGITGSGQLIASLPAENRAWVWDTRADDGVQEISGIGNGVVVQATVQGLVVQYPPTQYAVGRLENGAFLQVAELVARDADFSDPLGQRVIFADGNGAIHVRELPTRGRNRRGSVDIRLRLPLLDDFAGVHWEDTDHVILDVYDASAPDGALVRCDVRDGTCELADQLEGPHVLPH